jgi:hypothetical protein
MIEPNGCKHCGVAKRSHPGLWSEGLGWHQYVEPSDEQRLERMKERRSHQISPHEPTRYPKPVDDTKCATCGSEVLSTDIPSVAVVQWVPYGQSNLLLAVLCARPNCLAIWAAHRVAIG